MEDGAARKGDSTSADEKTNCPSREREGRPSLNSLVLLRKAITPDDVKSMDIKDWHPAVYKGVSQKYLRKKKEDIAATKGDSTSADEETSRPSREQEGRPSLNSLALLRKAITPDDIKDVKDWHRAVYEGVFLKNSRKKMEDGAATKGDSTSADEETNRPSREQEGRPSLNCLALLRKAITPDEIKSMDIKDWHPAVYDTQLHKNCFLVLPQACDFAGSDEESCWNWTTVKEKWFSFRKDANIRVPKSKELSWLLIQGRFKTRALSPSTTYGVAFVVKLNKTDSERPSPGELNRTDSERPSPAELNQTDSERFSSVELNETDSKRPSLVGLNISDFTRTSLVGLNINDFTRTSLNLELNLPDGTKQTYKETLGQRQEEWINLHAGKFKMGPKTVGTISFALWGDFHSPKMSLILKGVLIHPKD